MIQPRRLRGVGGPLALALVLLAPFGPLPVVAGTLTLARNAADEHAHRVSVRTSGVCSDVVIEHDAEPAEGSLRGDGSHEHREVCLSRSAEALLSKVSGKDVAMAGAAGLAQAAGLLGAPPARPACAPRAHRSPPGLHALRTVVLLV